jgi:hypothetical protein
MLFGRIRPFGGAGFAGGGYVWRWFAYPPWMSGPAFGLIPPFPGKDVTFWRSWTLWTGGFYSFFAAFGSCVFTGFDWS